MMQFCYFIMGILVSRGAMLGSYAPFGTAFLAAVPYQNIWASLGGAVLGYILPSSIHSGIRYIASILAVAAIRWTLNDLKQINTRALFAPLVAFAPTAATGIAMTTVMGFTSKSIVMVLTESLLSAAAAYFFARTLTLWSANKGIHSLDQQEFACISMTVCIGILSLASLTLGGASLGRIFAVLIVLLCAKYAGVAGGSVSGIAAGIVFSISSTSFTYLSGAYAFGGMMAGLFSPMGKVGTAAAFILSNAIVSFESGDLTTVITGVYEVMAATLLFMLIPKKATDQLSKLFVKPSEQIRTDGLRKSIIMRLDFAARALSAVSDSVDSVSKKLLKLNTPNIKGVFSKAIDETCHRCGLKVFCWEREYDHTMKAFREIEAPLLNSGAIDEKDFSSSFLSRCCKSLEMTTSINRCYDEFVAKEAAERRMGEIRGVIGEQFSGMGELLSDIASEFENYETFHQEATQRINALLKSWGIIPVDISCRVDKFQRMSVEIETLGMDQRKINKFQLAKEISKACGRTMDTPCISYTPDRCRIQLSERPRFAVEIGSAQHICNNGKLCGDNYCYFNDGMGRVIAVISDGMGTGGRAAVDGAMATGIMAQLAKAGLGFDCALRIVNSALLVKSGEESLATLDIVCIDLFTGKIDFLKAGAPVTFAKKNGKVTCIEAPSLPAGILTNIHFSEAKITLQEDDWILMISDGAIATGDRWIEEELKDWKDGSPQEFVNDIVDKSSKRRKDGHDDDVTALAIRLKEH